MKYKKKKNNPLWTLVCFLLLFAVIGSVYKFLISKESPTEFNTLELVFDDSDKLCKSGENIWVTNSGTIRYNNQNVSSVLNKDTLIWERTSLSGLSNFYGKYVWTDGENIYYSASSSQYVFNNGIWENKFWNINFLSAENIWTDGENIYYSAGYSKSYILDKESSSWTEKFFMGYADVYGSNIWTDGENIYYSGGNVHYKLNQSTFTWDKVTFYGLTSFYGNSIWTDGIDAYYSSADVQYVLHKESLTWRIKTWTGLTSFNACDVWTDGKYYFVTQSYQTYRFVHL